MVGRRVNLCIIGMGPRGLSVLERICAVAGTDPGTRATVHVIDSYLPGPGRVWRTDQPGDLLMNTVASQVTMFTDDSVDIAGPLVLGPSLYEWARFVTVMGPLDDVALAPEVLAEAARLGPDDYPSRSFYGHYLQWVFQRVTRTAPANVRVRLHRTTAVHLDDDGPADGTAMQTVRLADGYRISGLHAVVLCQGHVLTELSPRERALTAAAARHRLVYVPPANPADVDLGVIHPREPVALLGLGLTFFDHMALLTTGRGGRFVREDDGSLGYLPSGAEPQLYAGSRRGVPYHSRGENEKGPYGRHEPAVLTAEVVESLRRRSLNGTGLDFRREVWPLVAKEVETVYYATLLTATRGTAVAEAFRDRYLPVPWGDREEAAVRARFAVPVTEYWDWRRIARPYGDRRFTGPADFRAWLVGHLRHDLAEARRGNVSSPLKAALDVLRDLRNEVRLLVDHSGLRGSSHRADLDSWYTPLNAFLSIGPPPSRVEEMLALIDAGVLHPLGPQITSWFDEQAEMFAVRSEAVPGSETWTTALVDARLQDTDVRRTTDPLLRGLLRSGQCRPHRIPDPDEDSYETGGVAVTESPYHVINAQDRPHPRRFAFGVPTESVHWVTAAGIRPGVNSVTLTDADAIAGACLALSVESRAVPAGGSLRPGLRGMAAKAAI
ncbi:FAD/NAD(P)-binding protein [Streptomyces sp. NPDC047000]|uniref:FAD/NAD(P)-binding protein n=1 Tax=Streptomyces sp. NPDC047000 TaxID=3155474 RepID=UPI0033EFD664